MAINKLERTIKQFEETIIRSRGKVLQLEGADPTDVEAFNALLSERQFLEGLEAKLLQTKKELEKEPEELRKLNASYESLAKVLQKKFEEKAQPFIDRLADYLEGDLREEFIKIYEELQALDSEASRAYNEREMIKGGSGFGLPLLAGFNQFTFNTRVAKLLDSWEYNTRNEMIKRSKGAMEAMKK